MIACNVECNRSSGLESNTISNLTNILIWSSIFIGMYNLIQAKQFVMSKIMKYTDSYNERSMRHIASIKKSFDDFEEAKINLNGDITIKRRNTSKRIKERSVLTDVFKQMISNDIKKNRV